MSRARLLDLAAFVGFFLVAALLGRATVPEGSQLALLWPAAGVAAAWFAVSGWRRGLVLDGVLLVLCSWGVNTLTGIDSGVALGLAIGTLVQVLTFGVLISRWCPDMWGFGDDPPAGVPTVRDLGMLAAAAFISAAVASITGPTTLVFLTDGTWDLLVAWVLRNAIAVPAILPLSFLARHAVRSTTPAQSDLGRGGVAEAVALGLATVASTCWVFGFNDDLPVPFLVLATCVWAGNRFSSWVADIHALLVGAGVAVLTLAGEGPFARIDDVSTQGLVLQAFLTVVVAINLSLSVARREGLVLNQRLARAERAATEQATMLRTILDTMADGVSVVAQDGRLLVRNPAATDLVGDVRLDEAGHVDSGAYGMSLADGTPVARDAGPVHRALAGDDPEPIDLFVRNPAAPDGRMLEVTARRLPDTDPPSVVVVFHDVTADRRERGELASFAGVVAHDLLNPLTVVEGWSEALLDAARQGVQVPLERQVEQLSRIQRAAKRMQHLISDLLAYTTARDLRINPVRVDLAAVVADVAHARVDAARVSGGPTPVIHIDPDLPAVLAEPVLLRQVVDNVVGNAVKYVAPGVVPQIRVSGRVLEPESPDGAPMVAVEVSDNGIGIPVEQQSRVFDTFHRAHSEGGYRGTGLGLSIVKRIAERHGGTAWASTHEATGGTTLRVTFPRAD